ncbi:MAG TPA: nucleotidyl transferase AbiEii/AbiGii toxin family protein [Dissulfurispiraceae bacterium]|nr:nucleotidyl transferase AbiEii/AbiGii toxin family protein [Dissulfurispiraceae bacterium]
MAQNPFSDQVRLLMQLLPSVAKAECFALKGGTAINLFLRDMPRLSVDIDLAYLPVQDRDTSLTAIDLALEGIASDIAMQMPDCVIQFSVLKGTDKRFKLTVQRGEVLVKIEVTPVLRGSVYPAGQRVVSGRVQATYGYASMQLLSFEDIFAGKLCAALDRQHPRDIFDVMLLLENEGMTPRLVDAFLVYLMGHNRPMAELLDPKFQDMKALFDADFAGMTFEPISLDVLEEVRERMVQTVRRMLTRNDRHFLLSVKRGDVDWREFSVPDVEKLPAIQWKLHNLSRMDAVKRAEAVRKLEAVLSGESHV